MLRTPRQLRVALLEETDEESSFSGSLGGRPLGEGLDDVPILDDTDDDDPDTEPYADVDAPLRMLRVASYEQGVENINARPTGEDHAGIIVSTYNLTSTILGAGILSIPYALAQCGLVLGLFLLALTAVASTLSCNLILSSYLRTGRGSFGDLALVLYGPIVSNSVKLLIVVLNIGAASAYILVIKSLLPPSLCQIAGKESFLCDGPVADDVVTGILVFCVVFPLCCLENLSSLRHTSMLAFLFAVFLTVAIAVRSIQFGEYCGISYGPKSLTGVFQGLPVFCFSFVCHLNVLPVYSQLRKRSPVRMRNIFRNAIVFAMLLYCCAGSFGYVRFSCTPEGVPDNILAIGYFPIDDNLIAAARIAEALTCTLALPLIQYPTRVAIHSWLFAAPKFLHTSHSQQQIQQQQQQQQQGSAAGTMAENQHLLPRRTHGNTHNSLKVRAAESLLILIIGYTLALLVPNVSTVFGLLGSLCCSMVVFILPGVFYLGATRAVMSRVRELSVHELSANDRRALVHVLHQRILSWFMIIFGSLVAVLGTIATATSISSSSA